jgi:hypothetical protein
LVVEELKLADENRAASLVAAVQQLGPLSY